MTITDDYSFNTFASMIEAIDDENEIANLIEIQSKIFSI